MITTQLSPEATLELIEKRDLATDPGAVLGAIKTGVAEILALRKQKDGAYRERDHLVAFLAAFAIKYGGQAAITYHADKVGEPPWEDDWRNIVVILMPTPTGALMQLSWHIHDSELPLVAFLPRISSRNTAFEWDGHTTEDKYRRIVAMISAMFPDAPVEPVGL